MANDINLAELFSTVGGAIAAQSSGGGAGLNAFMDRLAKQREATLGREFQRRESQRARMFQLQRDQLQLEASREQRAADRKFAQDERIAGQQFTLDLNKQTEAFKKGMAAQQNAWDNEKAAAARLHDAEQRAIDRSWREGESAKDRQARIKEQTVAWERSSERDRLAREHDIAKQNLADTQAAARQKRGIEAAAEQQAKGIAAAAAAAEKAQAATSGEKALDRAFTAQQNESSRNFQREENERERAFQAAQSDKKLDHDERMVDKRLQEEQRKEDKKFETSAQSTYSYVLGQGTDEARDAIEAQLYNLLPDLLVLPDPQGGATSIPLDWNDREQMIPLLTEAAKRGYDYSQSVESVGQRSAQEQRLYAMTGGQVGFTSQADFLDTQRQQQSAKQRLERSMQTAQRIAEQVKAFGAKKHASAADAHAAAVEIRDQQVAAAQELGGLLQSETYGTFFGGTAEDGSTITTELSGMVTQVRNTLAATGDALIAAQEKVGDRRAGVYTPENPGAFVGFEPGFGGDPAETEEFETHVNSDAVKQKTQAWNAAAIEIADFSDTMMEYGGLSDEERQTVTDLKDYRTDSGHLDHARMLRELREAKLAGDDGKVEQLEGLIKRAHNFDIKSKRTTMARRASVETSADAVETFAEQELNSIGLRMFQGRQEIKQAVARYGFPQTDNPALADQLRAPKDAQEWLTFKQRFYSSDEGVANLTNNLMENMRLAPDAPSAAVTMIDQGKAMLAELGLSLDKNLETRVTNSIRNALGNMTPADITSASGVVPELVDYPFTVGNNLRNTQLQSSIDLMPAEDAEQYRENYTKKFFGIRIDPPTREELVKDIVTKMRGEGPALEQAEYDWWSNSAGAKHADQRMKLQAESAAERGDSASFYDLHQLFLNYSPDYRKTWAAPGRIRNQEAMKYQSGALRDGVDRDYIYGIKSLYAAYRGQTPRSDLDPSTLNIIDKIDYMRAANLGKISNLTAEQREVLGGVQKHLRGLSIKQLMNKLDSGKGFGFADLGLEGADADAMAEEGATVSRDPVMGIDTDSHIQQIDRSIAKVERTQMTPLLTWDLAPGDGVNYGVFDEPAKKAALTQLTEERNRMLELRVAQQSEVRIQARPRLASALTADAFKSMTAFASNFEQKIPGITQLEQDEVGLVITPEQADLKAMAETNDFSVSLNKALSIMHTTAAKAAQRRAVGLTHTVPAGDRNMIAKAMRLDVGNIREQIYALNRAISNSLGTAEGFTYDRLPPRIQSQVSEAEFNDFHGKLKLDGLAGSNARLMLATRLWAADQMAEDFIR